jgi:signal transduction histidine kinase
MRVVPDVPDGLDTLGNFDYELIERVITNLSSNALEYSAQEYTVSIRLRADDQHVHVSVQDHRIGLTSDDMNRLFQRYSRTDGAGVEGLMVLGWGCTCRKGLSKHMVADMGGVRGPRPRIDVPRDLAPIQQVAERLLRKGPYHGVLRK